MKRQIAMGLVIIMLLTMIVPDWGFAEASQMGEIYFRLDAAAQSLPSYQDYSLRVEFIGSDSPYSAQSNLAYFETYQKFVYQQDQTITLNIEVSGGELEAPFAFNQTLDTTIAKRQTLSIHIDPEMTDKEISITLEEVSIDVAFGHVDSSFSVSYSYEGSNIINSDRAIEAGTYDLYFTKMDGVNAYIVKETIEVDGSQNQIVSNALTPTTAYSVNANLTGYEHSALYVVEGNNSLTNINGASTLYSDIQGINLKFSGQKSGKWVFIGIPLSTLQSSIDLTTITATSRDLAVNPGYVNINGLYAFSDVNGNPVTLDYTQLGTYTFEINGASYDGGLNGGYLNLGNQPGTGTLTINIPELGINSVASTVTLNSGGSNGGNGQNVISDYVNYKIDIKDLDSNEVLVGSYATYDVEQNRVYVYLPENTRVLLNITGIKADGTEVELLPLSFDNGKHPQYIYDGMDHVLLLGNAQGGYGDMVFGMIEDHTPINLNIYKGVLGVLTLENLESTPENPSYFNGEVIYGIGYKLSNGSSSGSLSGGNAINGKLFIPVQEASLGVDYMYVVASPTIGNSTLPQANTEFLELSSKLGNSVNGFIDLGSAKFQEPTFKGTVLNQNGEPVNGIFISTWTPYEGTALDLSSVFYSPAVVPGDQGNHNTFYLAPLNHGFGQDVNLDIVSYSNAFKRISGAYDVLSGDTVLQEAQDQIEITMLTPDGSSIIAEGQGLDRAIVGYDTQGISTYYATTNQSITHISGFVEGETYSLQLQPDMGDFDHLNYVNGSMVTFTYTSVEGSYIAHDNSGSEVPFTVDSEGLMHLSLKIGEAQVYGQLLINGSPYDDQIEVSLYDTVTGEKITSGFSHTSGGYNGQPVKYGVFGFGYDLSLIGTYRLVVSDPSNTVYHSGKSQLVTLPLTGALKIELPKSKVFGQVLLAPEDQAQFTNSIARVYVNIFDATGQFVKNVLVRRDGVFSAGELENGRYFAKVFVSPFSTLAEKYISSKMNLFNVDNQQETPISFDVPLIKVIGQGSVITPEANVVQEGWVKIYNAQGIEIEAIKTNDSGVYKIPLLENGTYYLRAIGKDGFEDSTQSEIVITEQQISGNTHLELTEVQISGQVISSENMPISEVTVLLFDADKNMLSFKESEDGSYTFGGLVPGNYFIQARASSQSSYVDGALIPVTFDGNMIESHLTLKPVYYEGSVSSPQEDVISKGWVHVYVNNSYLKSVAIDENGQFKLERFDEPEKVTLVAEDSTGTYMESAALTLSASQSVALTVRTNVGLKGTLKNGSSILSRTLFYVYDESGKALFRGTTSVFGEMELTDVAFGKYTIIVPTDSGYLIGSVTYTEEGQVVESVSLKKGE